MGIYIGQFEFDGPDLESRDVRSQPGVYAILHLDENEEYSLIEVGEQESLASWAARTDFANISAECDGVVSLAVFYTDGPESARRSIVEAIETEFGDEQMVDEPVPGEICHQFELAALAEQM